jgi:hypothetical protein
VTPRLLDLCARAGGASVGYQRAGFDVTAVDIVDRSDVNPAPFRVADALAVLRELDWVRTFDLIHMSWPCQASTTLTKGTNAGRHYENLIPAGRELAKLTGVPFVLENVQGSALRRDVTLCGEMFGLGVIRHRYFEVHGLTVSQPAHVPHRGRVRGWRHGVYHDGPYLAVYGEGGGKGSVPEWQQAMGIDWMHDRVDLAESIPPAYTQWLGSQVISQLRAVAA